jgi:hypothetical protein
MPKRAWQSVVASGAGNWWPVLITRIADGLATAPVLLATVMANPPAGFGAATPGRTAKEARTTTATVASRALPEILIAVIPASRIGLAEAGIPHPQGAPPSAEANPATLPPQAHGAYRYAWPVASNRSAAPIQQP